MPRRAASKVDSPDKRLNMRKPLPTVEQLHAQGKAMRETVPRELHGQWKPHAQREDILSIIKRSNAGRQERLIPDSNHRTYRCAGRGCARGELRPVWLTAP